MLGVGANFQIALGIAAASPPTLAADSGSAIGTGIGSGVGSLDTTCQCAGAVTVNVKVGLEVRLVEHGEHASAVGDLELRVQVDLVIHRVDEAVQALAGVHVSTGRIDRQLVDAGLQCRELDSNTVELRCRVKRLTVEDDLLDGRRDQVDERARAVFGRRELHSGPGPEARGSGGEVEGDVIRGHGQQRGALSGFVASQVLARHGVISCLDASFGQ